MAAVVSGVVVLAGGVAAGLVSTRARRENPCAAGAYAPRDAAARDPLSRRLRQGYASVEIVVWLDDTDRLLVGGSRDYTDPGAELDRLILRPLADRIGTFHGRVYADSPAPFRLVIAIDEPDPHRLERAYGRLEAQLGEHPEVFTRVVDGAVRTGPVTVLLTGDHMPPLALAGAGQRRTFADGTFADLGPWGAPPTVAPLLSEPWSERFDWDGRREMPADERNALHRLVAAAHAEGRQVHFAGLPERGWRVREAFWCELAAAGVDLITTTRPRALANFLRGYGTPAPALATVAHPRPVRRTVAVPVQTSVHRSARRAGGRPATVPAQVGTPARHRVSRPGGATRVGTP
jgi:hypothetical protein